MKKSTLRRILVGGVVFFSFVLVALTVNTMPYFPRSTNAHALTTQVVEGKLAWQRHDCIGCHALLGNGVHHAPDLTRVHQVRGSASLSTWLAAPAGQMPDQHLTAQEVQDLTVFLDWVAKIDTNGWPPAPIGRAAAAADTTAAGARALFEGKGCATCHGADAAGTATAPSLIGVTQHFDGAYLTRWLQNPAAVTPNPTMPALGLGTPEIESLLVYLHTLDG